MLCILFSCFLETEKDIMEIPLFGQNELEQQNQRRYADFILNLIDEWLLIIDYVNEKGHMKILKTEQQIIKFCLKRIVEVLYTTKQEQNNTIEK